uniref:Uncharacterized protein n=1 Tax=Arundo donax TaxID=35708 RepID=A0A0A8ZRV5_ARUDO
MQSTSSKFNLQYVHKIYHENSMYRFIWTNTSIVA